MIKTKFTKGKWQMSMLYNTILEINVNGLHICEVDCCGNFNEDTGVVSPTEEERANAHLMMSAPDMYAEIQGDIDKLKASLEIDGLDNMFYLDIKDIIERKEALLAKARGE